MKYSFTCPAPDCGVVMTTEANSKEEALDNIMSMGADHQAKIHPNMPKQSPEEAKSMVEGGIKQE